MNKISTIKKYSIYDVFDIPYNDIVIDNLSIDELFDLLLPNNSIKGLVPTVSGWFIDEKDEEIVWQRILPNIGEKTICPILICPDDQDYFCTTIVVEIENNENKIRWNRIGVNKKYEFRNYESIGSEVDWFLNGMNLEFEIEEYKNTLAIIKKRKSEET